MYGVMQYFRDNKSTTKLLYGNTEINPENDYFYKSVIKDFYVDNVTVPKIYAVIRENAKKFGYTTQASVLSSLNIANIFTNTMRSFGYSTKIFKNMLIWFFFDLLDLK